MLNPVLTILAAGALQAGEVRELHADLAALALEIARCTEAAPAVPPALEAPLGVRDIPFHYDDLRPAPRPHVVPQVTYDWRSPVIFDLP